MTEDRGAALLLELNGTQALACHISNITCAVCRTEVVTVPAMLLYRPPRDIYDLVCRECTLVIMSTARVRIEKEDYSG